MVFLRSSSPHWISILNSFLIFLKQIQLAPLLFQLLVQIWTWISKRRLDMLQIWKSAWTVILFTKFQKIKWIYNRLLLLILWYSLSTQQRPHGLIQILSCYDHLRNPCYIIIFQVLIHQHFLLEFNQMYWLILQL